MALSAPGTCVDVFPSATQVEGSSARGCSFYHQNICSMSHATLCSPVNTIRVITYLRSWSNTGDAGKQPRGYGRLFLRVDRMSPALLGGQQGPQQRHICEPSAHAPPEGSDPPPQLPSTGLLAGQPPAAILGHPQLACWICRQLQHCQSTRSTLSLILTWRV